MKIVKTSLLSLLAVTMMFLSSCTHKDELVTLNVNVPENKEVIVGGEVKVTVVDERRNQEVLGKKRYGTKKIKIIGDNNLAKFFQEKLIAGLRESGINAVDRTNAKDPNTISVSIKSFKYSTSRGFIGESWLTAQVSMVVQNIKSKTTLSRTYSVERDRKYFVVSSKEQDEKAINSALQEIVTSILEDNAVKF